MEEAGSPETKAWAEAQNARTRAALDARPDRIELRDRLAELYAAGTSSGPVVRGDLVFSLDRWGDQEQAVLVTRPIDAAQPPTIVLDRLELGDDATTAIDWYHPSWDGRLLAYGTSAAGDERSTLRVLDLTTGDHLRDEVPHTRAASVAWLPDASGFAYTRYATGGDYDRHVFWHVLGEPWENDDVLFTDLPDPTAWPEVSISRDGRWVLVHVALGWSRVDVHLIDRTTGDRRTLIEGVEAASWFTVDEGRDRLVGHTTLAAGRGRVVEVPLDLNGASDPTGWRTIVAEGEGVIEGLALTSDSLLVATIHRAVAQLTHHQPDGSVVSTVPMPELASFAGMAGSREADVAFVSLTGFTRPPTSFRWTPAAGLEPWSDLPAAVDPSAFTVEQVTYPSTDGTDVALFLVRGADAGPDAPAPTVLTGYGGFAIAMSPAYSPIAVAHCERGGCFAVACIRGGNEEGEAWHQAGMRDRKQQVFDDFHAAADWLVETGRTTREQLTIRGGSNGGLLVAAALTQRPDLCRAAICAVPLTDMVRFPQFLIARLWIPEYGDPGVAEEFAWLYAYSPYHRVVDGACYPAVLVETGEEDSRVDPAHARKFAARLQEATSCGDEHPILVRIESRAGHGQGKPASRQAEEAADALAFIRWHTS